MRKILSQYLGNTPSSIKFSYNPYGKPYIKNNKIEFNISNSNEYAVLAIGSDTPTGIDIEHENIELDLNNMALAILSKNEYQQFLSFKSTVLQEKAFYRAWTCKEAFTKCLGLGFSFDVRCCQFNLNPLEDLELFSIDCPGLNPADYYITQFNTNVPNYAGVVVNKFARKKLCYYKFVF